MTSGQEASAGKAAAKRGNGEGSLFQRSPGTPWVARYWVQKGRRFVRVTRSTREFDRKRAERVLSAWLHEERNRRSARSAGIIDARSEAIAEAASTPLAVAIDDFAQSLRTGNPTEQHVRETVAHLRRAAGLPAKPAASPADEPDATAWRTVGGIDAKGLLRYIDDLKRRGRSARRQQAAIMACQAFTRWLAREGRIAHDPLQGLAKPSPATDRRLERRMLSRDEWGWLYATTAASGERGGLTGSERARLYAVAIGTGLRAGELSRLRVADVAFGRSRVRIMAPASTTKNRRAAEIEATHLADLLREACAHKAPPARLLAMPNRHRLAEIIRADLAAAREAWLASSMTPQVREEREATDFLAERNARGERFDFHALRVSYGNHLRAGGANLREVMTAMRHGSADLTMKTYGRDVDDEAAAPSRLLGWITRPTPDAHRATGTADAHGEPVAEPTPALRLTHETSPARPQRGQPGCQHGAGRGDTGLLDSATRSSIAASGRGRKIPENTPETRENPSDSSNAGGGSRTLTPRQGKRILNPSRLPIPPLRRVVGPCDQHGPGPGGG